MMRKLAWFSLFFGVADALFVGLLNQKWGFLLGAAAMLVSVLLLLRQHGWSRCALAALGFSVGLLWSAGYDAIALAPIQALEGQTLSFTATLRDDPQSTQYGVCVYADAKIGGRNCRVLLYLDKFPDARAGDQMELTAALSSPKAEDYDLYYRSIGVDLIAYAKPDTKIIKANSITMKTMPLHLRRALKDKLCILFPEEVRPFLHALLLGDRSGLRYADKNAMSVSGIAHTVAISGMHISVLLGLVLLLCRNRRWLSALIGIPIVVIFTLMVGAMPSVVRAAVMQILLLLSPLLMRESDPLTSLSAAALCILIPNPFAVANLSFQLSFGAMVGILLLSDRIYKRLAGFKPILAAMKNRLLRPLVCYFLGMIASACGSSVFTIPLIAWQYGMVSLFSLLTNLLTLWAVTLLFEGTLVMCILGFLWLWPAKLLSVPLAWLAHYILAVANWIARFPFSAVYTQNSYIVLWLIFVYCLFGLCLWLGWRKHLIFCACAGVLSLCLCLWLGYFESSRGEFRMTMLDVGQGQCLIFYDGDATMMYDCGGDGADKAGEAAARFLLSQGISSIDILVLSHYDVDHAGGVCQLMERISVDTLYLPALPCDTKLRAEIEAQANRQGANLRYVKTDESLCYEDAEVHIYAPIHTATENDASLALLYTKGSYDIFVTGDMSASAERLLLSRNSLPDVEVLVAGHHGASTSTCNDLLRLSAPETVLISVGESNPYGHPSASTLMRIYESGAQAYRTDQCGTITIRR